MAISKKSTRVLNKESYFEIVVCPPTSTLKLRLKTDINYISMYIEL